MFTAIATGSMHELVMGLGLLAIGLVGLCVGAVIEISGNKTGPKLMNTSIFLMIATIVLPLALTVPTAIIVAICFSGALKPIRSFSSRLAFPKEVASA